MTCAFCGSRNNDGEHRCRRCARTADDTLTGTVVHRTEGPLAVKYQPQVVEAPRPPAVRPFQPSLFQSASNVIPFEAYAPVEPSAPRERTVSGPAKPRQKRPARVPEGQGSLDFLAPAPLKPKTLGTTVEAVIYCDSPVAVPLHRAVAAALDWSMVLIGYGAFLGVFLKMGGAIEISKTTSLVYGATLLLFAFFYGAIWALAGTETPGMRWTGLKLVTFDGYPPETRQRLIRFAGSCLSLCSVVGMTWSLVDEESLGWQDHISRTFPTPAVADSLILVQK